MTQVGSGFQKLQNKGRVSAAWENSTASMALNSLVSPHERTKLAWKSGEPLFPFAVAGKVWLGVLGTRIGLPSIQSTHCCFSVVVLRVMQTHSCEVLSLHYHVYTHLVFNLRIWSPAALAWQEHRPRSRPVTSQRRQYAELDWLWLVDVLVHRGGHQDRPLVIQVSLGTRPVAVSSVAVQGRRSWWGCRTKVWRTNSPHPKKMSPSAV